MSDSVRSRGQVEGGGGAGVGDEEGRRAARLQLLQDVTLPLGLPCAMVCCAALRNVALRCDVLRCAARVGHSAAIRSCG